MEEGLVREHLLLLLRKRLRLEGGQILRGVELRVADGEAGGVVEQLRLIEAKARHVVVEGRMG